MASDHDARALAATVAFCEAAGIVPGYLTRDAFDGWYDSLDKPAFNPPGRVFAPVWTVLYLLMGLARYLAVEREDASSRAFDAQLVLNAWTLVFFGERSILGGIVVVVALWLAIVVTIVEFARTSRTAALLLVPYLVWVSFAALLNLSIWRRNR